MSARGTVNRADFCNNVTLHLLRQVIWGDIWKRTVEKNEINANNETLHLLRQLSFLALFFRKSIVQWKKSNKCYQYDFASSHKSHLRRHLKSHSQTFLGQTIWGHIWKRTVERGQTNITNELWQSPVWSGSTDNDNLVLKDYASSQAGNLRTLV